MKIIYWIVGVVVLVIISIVVKSNLNVDNIITDYKNATYLIDGEKITLQNGISEKGLATSSTTKLVTQYFGNEVKADFNNDGVNDIVFLLTQNRGGSGTFYYVALALGVKGGYTGENTILLGDRIAPQTTEFKDGIIVVNYADRKAGEPFTIKPSIGVSRYFKVEDKNLNEVKSKGVVASSSREKCEQNGGDWSVEFKECLGVTKSICESIGGTFNECASACRNNPKAEVCTLQCVQVCDIK